MGPGVSSNDVTSCGLTPYVQGDAGCVEVRNGSCGMRVRTSPTIRYVTLDLPLPFPPSPPHPGPHFQDCTRKAVKPMASGNFPSLNPFKERRKEQDPGHWTRITFLEALEDLPNLGHDSQNHTFQSYARAHLTREVTRQ